MAKEKEAGQNDKPSEEFERFEDAVRKIISTPKRDVDATIEELKREKKLNEKRIKKKPNP